MHSYTDTCMYSHTIVLPVMRCPISEHHWIAVWSTAGGLWHPPHKALTPYFVCVLYAQEREVVLVACVCVLMCHACVRVYMCEHMKLKCTLVPVLIPALHPLKAWAEWSSIVSLDGLTVPPLLTLCPIPIAALRRMWETGSSSRGSSPSANTLQRDTLKCESGKQPCRALWLACCHTLQLRVLVNNSRLAAAAVLRQCVCSTAALLCSQKCFHSGGSSIHIILASCSCKKIFEKWLWATAEFKTNKCR